jgi:hypothetical protein
MASSIELTPVTSIEIHEFFNQSTYFDPTGKSCPLQFFKANQHKYPRLSKLAKFLFSITATSVPSEVLFSHSGNIVTDYRNRLDPFKVEQVVFIKDNLGL